MKVITKTLIKLPKRGKLSKKGENGRVLVVGGSPEYIGASALAGMAALRSGADSVIVAAPEKVAWAINCLSADLVTKKLKGEFLSPANYSELKKYLSIADCIAIGSGIAERLQTRKLLKRVIVGFQGLKVLDAAALFVFDSKSLQNTVLTPNPKEFQRLKKYCNISRLIQKGNIIVAKSARTKIFAKDQIYENRTGNAGLTKAGTGDVLAGLIAGFAAQSKNLLQSAINGVYFVGILGDMLLKKKKGYFYLASDLAEEVKKIKSL